MASCLYAQSDTKVLCYKKENQTSLLPFVPKRLTSTSFSNTSSVLNCARRSYSVFPTSAGFLYSQESKHCSPLLWLEGPSSPGAQPVQPEEGDLYLSCDVCGDGFEIIELAHTGGELICLRYFNTDFVTQAEATSNCAAVGAYLAPVKTVAKLNIIRHMAISSVWVGFEFVTSQSYHIWSDNEMLTSQQKNDVFYPGEPSNYDGSENCGMFRYDYQALNDIGCWMKFTYICEKDLPF
ncbi:macrophage mannose receptor 1 [Elysia marginata]|uniref:Macrophage mannose receptor 1 n=1 Tax=Elysia marginata TaxID=1093978 RepID=A0AAV4IWL2_9GAST|nr:macrophage mannose receptor 1 [Elysia marginata]